MLDGLDSHVRPPASRRNQATEQFPGYQPAPNVDLRQAYGFARGVVQLQPAESGPGHRLVWVRGAAFSCSSLIASDDAFAVIGRHTQCELVLPDDPFVALRHVLVRSLTLPSGGVALRVFDLHTGLGFGLPDGTRHSSIFAEGPIAIAIGEYALVALPTETSGNELPGELPPPVMETPPHVREQLQALASAMSPYRVNARSSNRMSRITLMPRPVMVGEAMPPTLGRLATGGQYALTLSRAGRSATVTLSEEDISRGVMIGRSEKCHAEMLRRITDENTSRTHILVLREGGAVSAYDLASTHGTFVNGLPARRVRLFKSGTSVSLGRGKNAVRLSWHARG